MYYQFMDKFHVKPETFDDLFDFLDYTSVDSKLKSYYNGIMKLQSGG